MESGSNQPPLVVIVGETASGKSALALEVAQRFNGEIVCADSWTVRREVNIGTAKPTAEDKAKIRHHLLDVVAPCSDFSAAAFKRLAEKAIIDIASRGKLSVMVGGTGLYTDSVVYDYSFLPQAEKQLRNELNELSLEQLTERIREQGLSLEGIDTRNKRRLIRVVESGGDRATHKAMRSCTIILGISLPKEDLLQRVTMRAEQMLQGGLEQEARKLADGYGWECEALKGIGYREWAAYFAGTQDLTQTKERIIKATMSLAKRQRTWFRRNPDIHWISKKEDGVDLITTFLNKGSIAKP